MSEPTIQALTAAMDSSAKVASSPGIMTAVDKFFGFKLSEWKAQGEVIRQQINDGYKEAQEKGLGMEYATAFREKANVLNTLSKATEYIKKGFVREVGFDEDVFWNLIEHSKSVSDEDVQDLISKIIAGEYSEPGTYSMATIQALKLMGKGELEAFERIGSLLISNNEFLSSTFVLRGDYAEFIKNINVTYDEFRELQTFGLIDIEKVARQYNLSDYPTVYVNYFDATLVYKKDDGYNGEITTPSCYSVTKVGMQIMSHLNPVRNEYYFSWLKENYKIPHMTLQSD